MPHSRSTLPITSISLRGLVSYALYTTRKGLDVLVNTIAKNGTGYCKPF